MPDAHGHSYVSEELLDASHIEVLDILRLGGSPSRSEMGENIEFVEFACLHRFALLFVKKYSIFLF